MSWQYPLASAQGGAAGGDLAGTYPNPTIGAGKVTTAKIANLAVTAALIANNTITSTQIASNAVIAAGIATAAVTTTKISDGNVTLAKLDTALPYLRVQTGVPTTFTSPLVLDNTPVTGDLYGWNGTAYAKAAGLPV